MSDYCFRENGIWMVTCPICNSVRPTVDGQPVDHAVYCNVNCFYLGHRFDPPEPLAPTEGG